MGAYILRRLLYALPILVGVNIITFFLFFVVNSPDDMARMHLGVKRVTPEAVEKWKSLRGYARPLFWNRDADGMDTITDTIFYQHSVKLFVFDFGVSDGGRDISRDISQRMWPSLAITVPTLLLGLLVCITVGLGLAFLRATWIDTAGVVICVLMLSVSSLFYIIGGQFLIGRLLLLTPISGYDSGLHAVKFVALPVLVGVISGIGASGRWYRSIFLEEMGRDYVRSARAKGVSERIVLYRHVLKNGLLPILTGVVVILPSLFIGGLITESFFAVPGLGSYTIDAIQNQDFSIVRSMVFLGAVLYIIGLILTDISYTLADPRVRLR